MNTFADELRQAEFEKLAKQVVNNGQPIAPEQVDAVLARLYANDAYIHEFELACLRELERVRKATFSNFDAVVRRSMNV